MAEFPAAADLGRMRDDALQARWDVLLDARSAVNARLEGLREKKVIGSSLQASVVLDVNDAAAAGLLETLRRRAADALHRVAGDARPDAQRAPRRRRRAPRPRHRRPGRAGNGPSRRPQRKARSARGAGGSCPTVSSASESLGLCDRCVDAMAAGRGRGMMMPDQTPSRTRPAAPSPDGRWLHWRGRVAVRTGRPAPRTYARPTELLIMTAIVVVDQLTKEIVRRTLPLHGEPAQIIPGVARSHARAEHGRGVRPAERRRLPLQGRGHDRHRRHGADRHRRLRGAARLPRTAGTPRAVAHPGRGLRQPHRSRRSSATSWTSSTSTGARRTSGPSTSPTPPSPSARFSSSST